MKVVYKYTLELVSDTMQLDMPKDSQLLRFDMQHGQPRIWALIDTSERAVETRHLRIAGTGHPIAEPIKWYVGSVLMTEGMLVLHLFEVEAPIGNQEST
jgi:hypothetical protein